VLEASAGTAPERGIVGPRGEPDSYRGGFSRRATTRVL